MKREREQDNDLELWENILGMFEKQQNEIGPDESLVTANERVRGEVERRMPHPATAPLPGQRRVFGVSSLGVDATILPLLRMDTTTLKATCSTDRRFRQLCQSQRFRSQYLSYHFPKIFGQNGGIPTVCWDVIDDILAKSNRTSLQFLMHITSLSEKHLEEITMGLNNMKRFFEKYNSFEPVFSDEDIATRSSEEYPDILKPKVRIDTLISREPTIILSLIDLKFVSNLDNKEYIRSILSFPEIKEKNYEPVYPGENSYSLQWFGSYNLVFQTRFSENYRPNRPFISDEQQRKLLCWQFVALVLKSVHIF